MHIWNHIKKARHKLYLALYHLLPIKKNKILLWANSFHSYGDSPKYIAEYLIQNSPNQYEIVWVFETGVPIPENIPNSIRVVRYFSTEYLREICTAKFIICNARTNDAYYFKKRKSQVYIQTWHSSMRLKKIEGDTAETLPESYINAAKADSKKIDLLLSGCRFSTEFFQRAFWYNGDILESGTPRCDLFFGNITSIRQKVFSYYNLPASSKLVIYAPTFRNSKQPQTHGIDFSMLKSALEERTGDTWIVGCRLHPNILEDIQSDDVISMSKYPDMQELLVAADCLITDYSSCMFDMAIAKKECLLYVPDIDEYIRQERGLYFDIMKLPFPVCTNAKELKESIINFNTVKYQAQIDHFLQNIGSYENGTAAQQVANYIKRKAQK